MLAIPRFPRIPTCVVFHQVLNKYCLSSDLLEDSAKLLYLNRKLKELKDHVSAILFLLLPAWKRALFSSRRPSLPSSNTLKLVILVEFGMGRGCL